MAVSRTGYTSAVVDAFVTEVPFKIKVFATLTKTVARTSASLRPVPAVDKIRSFT